MIKLIWHNPDNVSLEELKAEGFNGILIRTTWILGDTMKTYLGRMVEMYNKAEKLGFTFFLIDYCQGMGELNDNYNYKIVADYFKNLPGVCFYIGESYEEFVEKQKFDVYDVVVVLRSKIEYVDGNVLTDSTKRNIFDLKFDLGDIVDYTAISSYWRQQTKWYLTNAVWISGQLGYHNISSWRYKSLSKLAKKQNKVIVSLYQFNPSNWSSDGWENKIYDILFGWLYSRKKLEARRRKLFVKYF